MEIQDAINESIKKYFNGDELSEMKPKKGKKFRYTKKYFDEFFERNKNAIAEEYDDGEV